MALAAWHTTITDLKGNVIPNARVEVRDEETGALAVLFKDRNGTVGLGNPFIADGEGLAVFFCIGGAYRVTATGNGGIREWRYVGVGTAQEADIDELLAIVAEDIFDDKSVVMATEIQDSVNAIRLNGSASVGDGLGGLYVDFDNGSTDTVVSGDGRTWYRVKDVGSSRLSDEVRRTSRATITHNRQDGVTFDVITLYGDPTKLKKKVGTDITPSGIAERVTIREFIKEHNYPVLVNADGVYAATPGTPWDEDPFARGCGLQITDGIVYQEWLPSEARTQNAVMMNDGRLRMAYKNDGISGQEWVDMGALWTVGWGAACVLDGEIVDPIPSYMNPIPSSRTILGQRENGEILIIAVEGRSGIYGLLPSECGALAKSLGCVFSYICDGGGSTQVWWDNAYAYPTSDSTERALYSYFCLDIPAVPVYDSGDIIIKRPDWCLGRRQPNYRSVSMRQVGNEVTVRFNLDGPTTPGNAIPLAGETLPPRYFADGTGQMRGLVHQGVSGYVYSNEAGLLQMSSSTQAMAYVMGSMSWIVKWSAKSTRNLLELDS